MREKMREKDCICGFSLIIALIILVPVFVVLNKKHQTFTIVSVSNITNITNINDVDVGVSINIIAKNNKTCQLVLVYWGNQYVGNDYFNYSADTGMNFTRILKNLSPKSPYIIYLSERQHVVSNEYKFWSA